MVNVIIFGTGKLGQMVYYLLRDQSEYQVVCFTADQQYCKDDTFLSLPLVPFEVIEEKYPPTNNKMLTVIGGLSDVKIREEMFHQAKEKSYQHINYVHPTVIVEGSIIMGENNIVFPYSILGFSGRMGNNNLIREKVYLGHDFHIFNHCFIGVGCEIGGESKINDLSYIAMGTTISNNIELQEGTFIGIGSLVLAGTEKNSRYYGRPAKKIQKQNMESKNG